MNTFRCRIATLGGVVFDEEVTSLYVPSSEGVLGILPNRVPIVASLTIKKGILKATAWKEGDNEEEHIFVVDGGTLSAKRKESIVLTKSCQEFPSYEEALASLQSPQS